MSFENPIEEKITKPAEKNEDFLKNPILLENLEDMSQDFRDSVKPEIRDGLVDLGTHGYVEGAGSYDLAFNPETGKFLAGYDIFGVTGNNYNISHFDNLKDAYDYCSEKK